MVTMIERGSITDWARLAEEFDHDPWGEVARQVEDYLAYEQPYGVAPLLRRAIAHARARAEAAERQQVAAQVRLLLEKSGLMPAQFARRIGTSRSRLSTYRSGTVTPLVALLVRMGKVAEAAGDERLRRSGAET